MRHVMGARGHRSTPRPCLGDRRWRGAAVRRGIRVHHRGERVRRLDTWPDSNAASARTGLVSALPGRHTCLVALDVGEHPEGRGMIGGYEPATGRQRGLDPAGRLVVRNTDVEVDAIAL